MARNKKHIFGILLPQLLWAFPAMTARYSPIQDMHWTEQSISFESYAEHDAPCALASGPPHSKPNRRDDSVCAQTWLLIDDLTREDVSHILDTFPNLRRKEPAAFGEYQPKRKAMEEFEKFPSEAEPL